MVGRQREGQGSAQYVTVLQVAVDGRIKNIAYYPSCVVLVAHVRIAVLAQCAAARLRLHCLEGFFCDRSMAHELSPIRDVNPVGLSS